VHELSSQIADSQAVAKIMREFARAFTTSMPTGKQNTFANRTVPDAVLVSIRTDQPVNLVGAFENPVKSQGDGFVKGSCANLVKYANGVYGDFVGTPNRAFVVGADLADLGELVSLPEVLEFLHDEIANRLGIEADFSEV
jgi:CRISPR system Cascade subunit CasC